MPLSERNANLFAVTRRALALSPEGNKKERSDVFDLFDYLIY